MNQIETNLTEKLQQRLDDTGGVNRVIRDHGDGTGSSDCPVKMRRLECRSHSYLNCGDTKNVESSFWKL